MLALTVSTHLSSLARLETLSRSRNLPVAVSAAARAPAVATGLLDVAERTGLAPRGGSSWVFLTDSPRIARGLLAAAERAGVPRGAFIAEMMAALADADAAELSPHLLPTED